MAETPPDDLRTIVAEKPPPLDLDQIRAEYTETADAVNWHCDPMDAIAWIPALVDELDRIRYELEITRKAFAMVHPATMRDTPPALGTLAAEVLLRMGAGASFGTEEIADAVLAAVLPVHRRQVLDEAAQAIIDHRDRHFPADGNDAQRRVRRILQIAIQVVSPTPTKAEIGEALINMGVLKLAATGPADPPSATLAAERGEAVPQATLGLAGWCEHGVGMLDACDHCTPDGAAEAPEARGAAEGDLRTRIEEALRTVAHNGPFITGPPRSRYLAPEYATKLTDAVLAVIEPELERRRLEHRRLVLDEAAGALIDAGNDPYRNAAWMYADEAAALVRRLAATGPQPPASPPQPAREDTAVPQETAGSTTALVGDVFAAQARLAEVFRQDQAVGYEPTPEPKAVGGDTVALEDLDQPGPRRWELPAEPGPEVTAVRDKYDCRWEHTVERWLATTSDPGIYLDWPTLLARAPLTDASGEQPTGRFEQLLGGEHEQFDRAGDVLRSVVEYQNAPGLAATSTLRARSCPTCHSIGPRRIIDRTYDDRPVWCGDTWHGRGAAFESDPQRPAAAATPEEPAVPEEAPEAYDGSRRACDACGDSGVCGICRGGSTGEPGQSCLTCGNTHCCPTCNPAEPGGALATLRTRIANAIWADGLGPVMSPEDLADAVFAVIHAPADPTATPDDLEQIRARLRDAADEAVRAEMTRLVAERDRARAQLAKTLDVLAAGSALRERFVQRATVAEAERDRLADTLQRIRKALVELCRREIQHAGHGRDGHLDETDLELIADALDDAGTAQTDRSQT